MTQRVLQLHQLDKNVVFRIKTGSGHRRLKIKRQPFLHALHAGALGQIQKQGQIQNYRRRQNRITAKKVDLDLHRITQPPENIDIVPALFVVTTRRVVIDSNDVRKTLVELRIDFRLKNVFKDRKLRLFLGLE